MISLANISILEGVWVTINAIGLAINALSFRDAHAALGRFKRHPRASLFPARERMVKQNIRNTRGRALFNVGFLFVGYAAMTRPPSGQPMSITSWVFTGVLLFVATYGAMLDYLEYKDRRDVLRMVRDGQFHPIGTEGEV